MKTWICCFFFFLYREKFSIVWADNTFLVEIYKNLSEKKKDQKNNFKNQFIRWLIRITSIQILFNIIGRKFHIKTSRRKKKCFNVRNLNVPHSYTWKDDFLYKLFRGKLFSLTFFDVQNLITHKITYFIHMTEYKNMALVLGLDFNRIQL